ncbi:glycosyltransferase family 4 protein [Azospirillum halopraeferens]|uniref:glycosyltransferase family 4 protein n=1 Tax=Azospirillum halopraeferens TaxID=34010 RepID=UPI0004147B6F|nr:glycosyltransferase family 4 protein [Azospirillum halopraeferens]
MRLAFLDFAGWTYTPDTPYERPLGGMQSAACYLAEALARRGHGVSLLTGDAPPVTVRGVAVQPATGEACRAALTGTDAAIVVGGCTATVAAFLREAAPPPARLVLWTGHAHDQPAVAPLADPAVRGLFDSVALVSDWQRGRFHAAFGLDAGRTAVLRNAIAPAFEALIPEDEPVLAGRPRPPVLAYTSTPYRGLNLLLAGFPHLRPLVPGVRLRVFSSMAVYDGTAPEADPFTSLYDRARSLEGVEYVGAVPQPELARALRSVSCLAYPNSFEETSCIAVMEAMAAGCLIATCARAALPETLAGFGVTIPPDDDPGTFAGDFVQMLAWLLPRLQAEAPAFEDRLRRQVRHVNATGTWSVRAGEWERHLAR